MSAGNALRLMTQVLVLPVIARILGPSSYGLVALASPFFFFLLLFGDLGLGATLVRAPSVSRAQESSVFWVTLTIASTLAAVLVLTAGLAGRLVGEPAISPLIIGFAPIFLIAAAALVPSARLQREGRFVTVALADTISTLAGVSAAIYGALSGWGPWSLIAQQLTLWAVKAAIVIGATRFYPAIAFDRAIIKTSLYFGSALVGSHLASFLGANLDNVLIGTFLGTARLGVYALAFQIVTIPCMILGSAHYSLMPAVAEAHRNGIAPERTYLEALRLMLLLAVPAIVGLALTADLLIPLLFGEAWSETASLIRWLAPAGIIFTVFILNGATILGVGRSGVELWTTLMRTGLTALGIIVGLSWDSTGVACGISLAIIISGFFYMRVVLRTCGISWAGVLKAASAPFTAGAALAAGVLVLRWTVFDHSAPVIDFMLSVVSGVLIYLFSLFILFREKFIKDIDVIRSLVANKA